MSIISFSHVTKKYPGDVFALSDLTLSVNEGELVFLTGPSGAGKSTLLKLVAGIERPTGGVLLVSGQDMRKLNRTTLPFLRRKLGLILQQHRLLHDRSVLDNVMLPLVVAGASPQESRQRAMVALERVGLDNKAAAAPMSLSGGEQQRVSIARAIVHKPRIILADENL
jgi:cell division transport system ATP-binding protein